MSPPLAGFILLWTCRSLGLRLGLRPRLPAQFRTSMVRVRLRLATSETTFKILLKNLKAFLKI
jgi:hypothetical protein